MAHNYAINDDVHHQQQGPQGRATVKERSVYTIVSCLPIEADGRPRYRIKSKSENVERVVTEEQIAGPDMVVLHAPIQLRGDAARVPNCLKLRLLVGLLHRAHPCFHGQL